MINNKNIKFTILNRYIYNYTNMGNKKPLWAFTTIIKEGFLYYLLLAAYSPYAA